MLLKNKLFGFLPVLDGFVKYDDPAGGTSTTTTTTTTENDEVPDPDDLESDEFKDKKFGQAEVNKILAKERRNAQNKINARIAELTAAKESKTATEQEKAALQVRIEDLQRSIQTKEQLATEKLAKIQSESKAELERVAKERDEWRTRHEDSLLLGDLANAANEEGAFSTEQLVALLRPKSKVIHVVGEDQKPTGELVVKVYETATDKDGKKSVLVLTPREAVKRMKENTSVFGNLFKDNLKGGLGGTNQAPGRPVAIEDVKTPEEYRKNRGRFKS